MFGIVALGALALIALFIIRPASAPWTTTGHLTILVRATPQVIKEASYSIGFGMDNMVLYREDGEFERVTMLTKRILLEPGSDKLTLMLDTEVPIGKYTGFGFVIKSPEMKNAWDQDEAPKHIELLGNLMRLSVPYSIEKGDTSAIILAFETQTAIHVRDDIQFYLPVVQIETRRGVALSTDPEVTVEGGEIENSATFGMDWDGSVRFNFRAKDPTQESTEPEVSTTEEQGAEETNAELSATTTEETTATSSEDSPQE